MHVLIEKAYVYEDIKRESSPQECFYDRSCGFWRVSSTGEIMMISDYSRKPQSKKCDIETGEDQKGE